MHTPINNKHPYLNSCEFDLYFTFCYVFATFYHLLLRSATFRFVFFYLL